MTGMLYLRVLEFCGHSYGEDYMVKKITKWVVLVPIKVVEWAMWPIVKVHAWLHKLGQKK